jgi:NAD(P)-dependent dehydrogenase (short-subunit alcohol dehydrogenase family)
MARVLVAGGAGGVGEGIVRHLLRAGHFVVVPSRSQAKLDLIRERLALDVPLGDGTIERLTTLVARVGEPDGAEALCAQLERAGGVDVAIASIGGWWEGPLLEMAAAQWDAVMDEMLRAHFIFARTFVPMLQRRGSGRYIGIGGGAAYFPIPFAAPVSIAGAAQLMLTRALRAEVTDPAIDILELVIDGPVRTRNSEGATPGWIELDEIGPIVVELVETGVTHDLRAETEGSIVTMRSLATRELPGHHG